MFEFHFYIAFLPINDNIYIDKYSLIAKTKFTKLLHRQA